MMGRKGLLWPLGILCRPQQWYKNIIVFVALIYAGVVLDTAAVVHVLLAFAGMCLLSSAGYIINDIYDAASDRHHPEKANRPIARGAVRPAVAVLLAIMLTLAGALLLWSTTLEALVAGASVLGLTTLYTIWLRSEPVVDVLVLATNFVLRAGVGAFAIGVPLSAWLIVCTFSLALLLAVGKRVAEKKYLGVDATLHRRANDGYAATTGMLLMSVAATMTIIAYALYSFLHGPEALLATLPFAVYGIVRFTVLALAGEKAARNAHLLVFDGRMMLASMAWCILTFSVLYFP